MPLPYPELLSIRFDGAFAQRLREFIEPIASALSWRELGMIPRDATTAPAHRALAALAMSTARGHPPYLGHTGAQELARRAHSALRGTRAARWYAFLCLNHALDVRELLPAWREPELDRFIEARVLLGDGSTVMLPVTIAPWGRRWYVSESLHLRDNAAAYGTRGVPLDLETHAQVRWLRHAFSSRRVRRFFEVGTATGIVTLELSGIAASREGGEYDPRGLMFAQLNRELWDRDVRFVETNILSGARGRYDLIHFGPWQPTESALDVVLGYIDMAPDYLEPDGEAVVFVTHRGTADDDAVLTPIAHALARRGLIAEQDVLNAYDHGAAGILAQSFLRIRRGHRARPIQPRVSPQWLAFETRRRWLRGRGAAPQAPA